MASNPAEVLGVPRPNWMPDDVVMLEDMATAGFMTEEVLRITTASRKQEMVDRSAGKSAGAAGLLCASMPEEYGGSGGTYAHEAAILEALSHVGVDGFGIALHNAIVAPYILHFGSEEQKQKWLPKMATGEMIGAIAMTEPGAGSDLQGIKTTAKKDGNHYVINGSKTFITNGQHANLIIVVTKTDPTGRQGHLADGGRDRRGRGVPARPQSRQGRAEDRTTRRSCSSTMCVCRPRTCSARGRPGLRPADDRTAAGTVADRQQAISMIERALAITIDYVKERKAFGKAVIEFQNTQFKLAELKSEATMARVFSITASASTWKGQLSRPPPRWRNT
jgi:acyl-CoA dehydrogenase